MLRTLELDDDWDPIDILEHVEAAFGVKIEDYEAEKIFLVGELYDTLKKKLDGRDGIPDLCFTSKVFYQLRSGLKGCLGMARIAPSDELLPLLRGQPPREVKRTLEEHTGLRLPALKAGASQTLGAIFTFASIVAFAAALDGNFSFWVAILMLVMGSVLINLPYGTRFSKDFESLGLLTRKVAALNYGALSEKYGVPVRSRLWGALTIVLSDYCGVDAAEIGRDTRFLLQDVKIGAS